MSRIRSALSACLRVVVLILLYLAVRLTWSVRLHGLRHDTRARSTYYAITHKRDFDSMAPVPPILLHRGWRAVVGEVRFAMRSDSLTRGFLARVVRRPAWFVWLLRPVAVGPVVRALGVFPLQKVSSGPLEEWLRDCRRAVGNVTAGQALAATTIAELAATGHLDERKMASARLSRLLRWRFHPALIRYVGPDALAGEARRATERHVALRARRYLTDIAAWMRAGGSVYSAPEGQFSLDGHLSRITSGFNRVLREAPGEAQVVPITIMYDFMTTGRPRMFIDVSPAIERAPGLTRDELNARLSRAWMQAARYTCTQLASGHLVRSQLAGRPTFSQTELVDTVLRQARQLHAQGRAVDARLLTRRGVRRRVGRYLAFAGRAGQVQRISRSAWQVRPLTLTLDVPAGEAGYRDAAVVYAWNELQDMGLPDDEPSAASADELTA
jgi:hypothetical protein